MIGPCLRTPQLSYTVYCTQAWTSKELKALKLWEKLTYCLALRPSGSLGLLNYRSPFFPIDCLLTPSLNIRLMQILFHIFHPSPSSSSPSSTSLQLTLKYFLNYPYLIHFYYMPNPFQSLL